MAFARCPSKVAARRVDPQLRSAPFVAVDVRGSVIAVVAASVLAHVTPADAATVHVTVSAGDRVNAPSAYVQFSASPGEVNAVTAMGQTGGEASIRDEGAILEAGSGCRSIDVRAVVCSSSHRLAGIDAYLGDGSDRLAISGDVFATVLGDAGDDVIEAGEGIWSRLHGGSGADRLRSGAGSDRLVGGAGVDELQAGGGDDELVGDGDDHGATAEGDIIDGGPGEDIVSYAGSDQGVRVDLAAPERAGAPGEADTLRAIEGVHGTRASDVLLGDDGPNRLFGGQAYAKGFSGDRIAGRGGRDELHGTASDDAIDGGAGRDVLIANGGRDRLNGGPGSDHLSLSTDRGSATLPGTSARCGAGRDRVYSPPPRLALRRDCEVVETDEFVEVRLLWVARDFSRLRLALRAELITRCRLRVLLRLPDRRTPAARITVPVTIGRRAYSIPIPRRTAAVLDRVRNPRLDVSLSSYRCGPPRDRGEIRLRLTRRLRR
jgi:hypothetical protein